MLKSKLINQMSRDKMLFCSKMIKKNLIVAMTYLKKLERPKNKTGNLIFVFTTNKFNMSKVCFQRLFRKLV